MTRNHPTADEPDPLIHADMVSLKSWGPAPKRATDGGMGENVVVDCGWGRLIFGQTFASADDLVAEVKAERPGQRDVAMYSRDPHVVLSLAPQELFLDPSHTYRLVLGSFAPPADPAPGCRVRPLKLRDADSVNRICLARHMVPTYEGFFDKHRTSATLVFLVAEDPATGDVIGWVTGVDHRAAFDDPDEGASLWSLAVEPQTALTGVGEALVTRLASEFKKRGRRFLDLSVMHDNSHAIALYRKLGFERVPVYCIKKKNPINENLFIGPPPEESLNIYARIIIDEARRRGIGVEVLDAENGFFIMTLGGRSVTCHESLSELTSAVAMSRCDDKAVTRRVLANAGLAVPDQAVVDKPEDARKFLEAHGHVVVKPARGEQGRGVRVDLTTIDEVDDAVEEARGMSEKVLIEEFVEGQDLRIIVIDNKVVAAAVRRPAQVQGDGLKTVRTLIEKQNRRRQAATGGESRIPMDAETRRCVVAEGYDMDDVLPEGEVLVVRKTANLHTGGTIHDVTDRLHPALVRAAVKGALALEIPVVGFDFLVRSVTRPEHVVVEANERPGLANHEPQPTAERFIDLLFPQTRAIVSVAGAARR